jgi:hypothetical protein
MVLARRNTLRRPIRQRLFAAVALCAYSAAAFGLPLPAAATPREAGEPFPCMGHACGCRTAEQCWTNCCCFTPEERWAWARAHDVQPPAYAERPAPSEEGWNTPRLRDRAEGEPAQATRRSCCRDRAAKACCGGGACAGADTTQPANEAPPSGVRWVPGVSALRCQGLTTLWVTTGTTLPPPPAVGWAPCETPEGSLHAPDAVACVLARTPPIPPPR